jgi:uncharacterized protein YutE (UPF0331/DUF86 family)
MSPRVLLRKLESLEEVLHHLEPHTKESMAVMIKHRFEIERLVQLAVDQSLAAAKRALSLKRVQIPDTGRETFLKLATLKILDRATATTLANAVGVRNILVHEYDEIDDSILFGSLAKGHKAFQKFVLSMSKLKF